MTQKLMVWRAHARVGLIAALMLAAGCGSTEVSPLAPQDGARTYTPDPAGTYTLLFVNGARLPATVYEGPLDGVGPDAKVRVVSSTLTLDSGGRFTASMQLDVIASSGEAESCCINGDTVRYQKDGPVLTLVSGDIEESPVRNNVMPGVGVVQASIDVTKSGKPLTYVYRK